MNFSRLAVTIAVLAPFAAAPALAQSDPTSMAHAAAANQLGVLEYCQGQGDVDGTAVSAEQSVIGHLPTGANAAADSAAEATGKTGTIAGNGSSMSLASVASSHNTTVSALCKQLGDSATRSASMMEQNGMGAAGMPTMPGGGAMPTMPSMPTMPTMPTMPGTGATQ